MRKGEHGEEKIHGKIGKQRVLHNREKKGGDTTKCREKNK